MKSYIFFIPDRPEIVISILFETGCINCSKISSSSWPMRLTKIIYPSPDKVTGNIIPACCKSPECFMCKRCSNIVVIKVSCLAIVASISTHRRILRAYHYPVRIYKLIIFIESFRSLSPSSYIVIANYIYLIHKFLFGFNPRKRCDVITSTCC